MYDEWLKVKINLLDLSGLRQRCRYSSTRPTETRPFQQQHWESWCNASWPLLKEEGVHHAASSCLQLQNTDEGCFLYIWIVEDEQEPGVIGTQRKPYRNLVKVE